jgi:hypothetical protein
VLDPQDLADVFKRVITCRAATTGVVENRSLFEEGILNHHQLEPIWPLEQAGTGIRIETCPSPGCVFENQTQDQSAAAAGQGSMSEKKGHLKLAKSTIDQLTFVSGSSTATLLCSFIFVDIKSVSH